MAPQELYLDQNPLQCIPPELALLPGLRKMYVDSQQGGKEAAQQQAHEGVAEGQAGDVRMAEAAGQGPAAGGPVQHGKGRAAGVVSGSVPYG